MCTCIFLKNDNNDTVMARTMDFSFELDPNFVFIPRNYPISFKHLEYKLDKHYAYIGLSSLINEYLFADGVNEHGLGVATLYFEGYASYQEKESDRKNIASYELVNWLLATCKTTEEVMVELGNIRVVQSYLKLLNKTTPLHWMVSDKGGKTIVIEYTENGLYVKENPTGVLTNSPNLDWHLTNLRNYVGLDRHQTQKKLINDMEITPFGQGGGSFGLPGDYTPASRFVRTVFNKLTCFIGQDKEQLIVSAINILNSVSISKGNVVTSADAVDYTQYTSYMDLESGHYYFKTYLNDKVRRASIHDFDLNGNRPVVRAVSKKPEFATI